MRVVDTSAFIEWLADTSAGGRVAPLLPPEESWIVPTIVQLELWKWLRREFDADRADAIVVFTQQCRVVPLDTAIALLAAELCATFKLATVDAVIYATARHHGASLLTCDAHFSGLEGVLYVPKHKADPTFS